MVCFCRVLHGKDGDLGAPGSPGPAVRGFKHLKVQYDVVERALICPVLSCFRVLLERRESRDPAALLDSRCVFISLHIFFI